MIIGDMDSVTDDVLRCGAEVIVHAYPDGRAPGLPRVNGLGVPAITFPAAATSEDLAMLLADEKGASSSSRSAPTPRSSSSWTRGAAGWPRRS